MAENDNALPELRLEFEALQRDLRRTKESCAALQERCTELTARIGHALARLTDIARPNATPAAPAPVNRINDTQLGLEPAQFPPIKIPTGADWREWQTASALAAEQARKLGTPLPDVQALWSACANSTDRKARFAAGLRAMNELEEWDDANRDSLPAIRELAKALFIWLRGEQQELLNASPLFANYRKLKNDFENALLERLSDTLKGAFKRTLDELEQWRQFMDRELRWWDGGGFDARTVRAVTDAYDLIVAETGDTAQRPLLATIEAFLRPSGVRRDARLKLNVRHADLPPVLQNHFQEDGSGGANTTTTAQSRVGRILHQRWYRVGPDEREIGELTKPLYRFAF